MVETNLLEMKKISKHFPGVQALSGVDFAVRKGEIHALVGHNGAGKSTLLKILAGIYQQDAGEVVFDGKPVDHWSPREVLDHGVSFIYQELNLVQDLTIAQNIFLGREPKSPIGLIDWKSLNHKAHQALKKIGEDDIAVTQPLNKLSVAQQQMVAIAKALDQNPQLLVLDEPTSRLSREEINKLFALLLELSKKDISIIYVSHRLEEIYKISKRVTVLRDGKLIATHITEKIKPEYLIEDMIGDHVRNAENAPAALKNSPILLEVEGLKGPKVNGVDLYLHKGEVLGIVGAVGAGKTELVHLLFGLEQPSSGKMKINGQVIEVKSTGKAIQQGMALCPEDRKAQGLILENPIMTNISLPSLKTFTRAGWIIQTSKERSHAIQMVDSLNIMAPSVRQLARFLSGGNQQKVVLAKWLSTHASIFLFDEPTVGVDIHGKMEIYELLKKLAREGAGVIFFTSDPEEGWRVCSRLLVMFEGRVNAELIPHKSTLDQVMVHVMGGKKNG